MTWGLEGKISGEELDAERAAIASKAFDVATNFVPGAGDVAAGLKDTLWETAIDTGKDEGLGALKGLIAAAGNAGFENLIQHNTMDQLLATGYLDSYDIDPAIESGRGEDQRFVDEIRFIDGSRAWRAGQDPHGRDTRARGTRAR